jgi:Protein of unknown function (DUF1698)
MKILDAYVQNAPSSQNVLDLFKGEWSSQLPTYLELVTQPGTAGLFEDSRVVWAEEVLGSFAGWNILELGPLEGGHSYMFQKKGASKITSIEANTRAFLKCLCIKEILGLNRVSFKLGDFMPFLRSDSEQYDMVFASGVLYHMEEPVELIKLISKVSDKVLLWTQYYDGNIISQKESLADKFSPVDTFGYDGAFYEFSTQAYKEALDWSGFCGGPKPVSKWLTRDSILRALKRYGFTDIQINFDSPDAQNGPAFAICAKK